MNVFAQAAADLHADPNLGEPATYFAKGQGPGLSIRVIRGSVSHTYPFAQDQVLPVFGQNIKAPTLVLHVLVSDVATVSQGDAFTLSDRRVLAIEALLAAEGVSWAVTCRDG